MNKIVGNMGFRKINGLTFTVKGKNVCLRVSDLKVMVLLNKVPQGVQQDQTFLMVYGSQ